MKLEMDLSANKRLTRICNVIDQSNWIRNLHEKTIKSEDMENNTAGMEKLKRESYRCVAYNPSCLPLEKRLEKLNKWDDYLYKTEGLNELLRFLECVHAVEGSVNALEDKLLERGIEINEKMFRDLCEGKLVASNLHHLMAQDLIEMDPICTSTPQRHSISPKTFVKEERKNTFVAPDFEYPPYISQMLKRNPLSDKIVIGPYGTCMPRKLLLDQINWSQTGQNITRKLLMAVFDRETLATHTLSGKPSPAFLGCNKPLKQQLDDKIVKDITYMVTNAFGMTEKEVRQVITTKCADENKMYRQRMERQRKRQSKENYNN